VISGLVRLMRPYYALPLSGGFVVILLYLRGGSLADMAWEVAWSAAALVCLISGGHVLNDVFDIEVDRLNSPRRPLPSGQVSGKAAVTLAISLFAASLLFAGLCGVRFLAGVSAVAGVLVVYDAFGKRMGIMKDVLVAAAAASLYPLAFALAEPVHTARLSVLFIHPVWFFLSTLGYEMLKDVRDHKGDQLLGRGLRYAGHAWFEKLAKGIVISGAAIAILPYVLGYCGSVYLAAAAMAAMPAVLAARYRPTAAIRCIYLEVVLITLGSLADLFH
jgi:geranylgeranylglycerol-phosphate geranylgeranyltransferase